MHFRVSKTVSWKRWNKLIPMIKFYIEELLTFSIIFVLFFFANRIAEILSYATRKKTTLPLKESK